MIHVLTVHWEDDRWVDVQLDRLKEHIRAPFRVYAFLNRLPRDHRSKYFYSSTEDVESHAIKLNLLGDMVLLSCSEPDDWLMFIDGDAFPVQDVVAYGEDKLRRHPLVAIQRAENLGDMQPHPSFCLTTVGFWKEIGGDWKPGYEWENREGKLVTDVGGNLLSILNARGIDWFAMRRSNKRNLHPIWFGLYDDVVYHHGAGFRKPVSRIDCAEHQIRVPALCPHVVTRLVYFYSAWIGPMKVSLRRNQALSEQVYQSIRRDPLFYRCFQEPEPSPEDGGA